MEGERIAAQFVADNLHSDVFEMLVNSSTSTTKKAMEAAYIRTDHQFLKQMALIEGNEIIISNLGDCRAVLFRNGVTKALTRYHRTERQDERKRIEDKMLNEGLGKPDTKTLTLTADMEYLVLASDGLWDQRTWKPCSVKGSLDDITVMIIDLTHFKSQYGSYP
uniref:PPM-type phosphatase domain-containing protein n=1 Tax=Solanum lycopersicum TaxID=4081 RepID=K4BEN5_SOLLC